MSPNDLVVLINQIISSHKIEIDGKKVVFDSKSGGISVVPHIILPGI